MRPSMFSGPMSPAQAEFMPNYAKCLMMQIITEVGYIFIGQVLRLKKAFDCFPCHSPHFEFKIQIIQECHNPVLTEWHMHEIS